MSETNPDPTKPPRDPRLLELRGRLEALFREFDAAGFCLFANGLGHAEVLPIFGASWSLMHEVPPPDIDGIRRDAMVYAMRASEDTPAEHAERTLNLTAALSTLLLQHAVTSVELHLRLCHVLGADHQLDQALMQVMRQLSFGGRSSILDLPDDAPDPGKGVH